MTRSLPRRLLRLGVQVAIFLALMIGVLLRLRLSGIPWWEVLLRPLLVFAFGMVLLSGRRWARWPFSALCLAYGWWYAVTALQATLPIDLRFVLALGALLEAGVAGIAFGIPPMPEASGDGRPGRPTGS